MSALKVLVLVALLGPLAAIAIAGAPRPTHMSEADASALIQARLVAENAELRRVLAARAADEAKAIAEKARGELEAVTTRLRAAYQIADGDELDAKTREIKRAPPATKTK